MSNVVFYEIETSSDFDNSVNRFIRKKKFRQLPNQIEELVNELERGEFKGDLLSHSDDPMYDLYKMRLPNPDTNVGKSNGYRIIYLAEHNNLIVALLAIYYKKEQEDLSDTYIAGMVDGFFAGLDN